VAADLERKCYAGQTVGIKLRFADFKIETRDHSLPHPVRTATDLRRAATQALKRAPLAHPLRLMGVRVGKLVAWDVNSEPKMPSSHIQQEQFALFN
jgi:DNA polymerase-4